MSILTLLGFALCVGNVLISASRTTIPLAIEGTVTGKKLLYEKKKGVDDVYMIFLGRSARYQVDKTVFNAVSVNTRLEKNKWTKFLTVGTSVVPLSWTTEVQSMLCVMIVAALAMFMANLVPNDDPDRKMTNGGTR